jgi:putative colanic acid biosynthesis acetyltransferase WcaF
MPREIAYNAAQDLQHPSSSDPYVRPAFSLANRLRRMAWNFCWLLLYRFSPRPFHAWRALLLRIFGARLGPRCHFYPNSRVWAPWNLLCADHVCAADGVEIYNPALIQLDSHVILSQDAYLCGATHDYNDPAFPLLAFTMHIEEHAWVCARASVAPGVHIGAGAVLGLGSVATRDLEPWSVSMGVPAVKIKDRNRTGGAV